MSFARSVSSKAVAARRSVSIVETKLTRSRTRMLRVMRVITKAAAEVESGRDRRNVVEARRIARRFRLDCVIRDPSTPLSLAANDVFSKWLGINGGCKAFPPPLPGRGALLSWNPGCSLADSLDPGLI